MNQNIKAVNEPIKSYKPGSSERISLQTKYDEMAGQTIEIPLIIGGQEIKTGDTGTCVMPHDHGHILASYHKGGEMKLNWLLTAPWIGGNPGQEHLLMCVPLFFEKRQNCSRVHGGIP